MCNRYSSTKNEARLTLRFASLQLPLSPRFNIAPTHRVPVVTMDDDGQAVAKVMRWGFSGYNGHPVTNAQSETARFKSMFRNAWAQRRCIIPADGFYEWKTEHRRKQPFRFVLEEEKLFWFAGLWAEETKIGKGNAHAAVDNETEHAFVILTREANADVLPIHDRMPLILREDEIETWLSPQTSREWIAEGIYPGTLRNYRVGAFVSTPGLETRECITPLPAAPVQGEFW